MVHYKIYNKTVNLPFVDFCVAIKVPQWGSREKIKERPRPLMDLYAEICQGRRFLDESGKIRSIHLPSIRCFACFIARCVLARKIASKLSAYNLDFISAALRQDRTYNLSALIDFHLAANRKKGGVSRGLIASHVLPLHGVVLHNLDIQFPIERLDLNFMIQHKFVSSWADLNNLSYELTFFKKSGWRVDKSDRLVNLPAPLLLNLDAREGWPLVEDELDTYIEEHSQHIEDDGEEAEDNFV
jgi:hypothetical protein